MLRILENFTIQISWFCLHAIHPMFVLKIMWGDVKWCDVMWTQQRKQYFNWKKILSSRNPSSRLSFPYDYISYQFRLQKLFTHAKNDVWFSILQTPGTPNVLAVLALSGLVYLVCLLFIVQMKKTHVIFLLKANCLQITFILL